MKLWGRIQNASVFQGNLDKSAYFEGWYFKLVDAAQANILAIIPGLALHPDSSQAHAFIQILDGTTAEYHYLEFPLSDFHASENGFEVSIGPNRFSDRRLEVDIVSKQIRLKGAITLGPTAFLPFRGAFPGIMGIFSFIPRMECYHGIVSMNHALHGHVKYNGLPLSFAGGKGYIEKDWGSSFPKKWIWMQGNHFNVFDRSFMCSIAQIRYMGLSFVGFIGLLYDRGKYYRFATYNLSKFRIESVSTKVVRLSIRTPKFFVRITATKETGAEGGTGIMKAPRAGLMTAKCAESITAHIRVNFYKKRARRYRPVFSDESGSSGLEIMGKRADFE